MEKTMSQSKDLINLPIIKKNNTIFSLVKEENLIYEIPLYQRAFAWTEKEIKQLIEDIFDFNGDNYFIGSLVVAKNERNYEVIDGQQRLTALFIILNCINWYQKENNIKSFPILNIPKTLRFSCRDKSNYTLDKIDEVINSNSKLKDEKLIADEIQSGITIVKEIFGSKTLIKDFDFNKFRTNIEKVILFRIEVPENTDLNHYFEIMNTRGEQLEQPDILKALLMDYLPLSTVNNDREIFSILWDAISDMNGYIQMHFDYSKVEKKQDPITKEEKTIISNREIVFKESWDEVPSNKWEDYKSVQVKNKYLGEELTIDTIISKENFKPIDYTEVEEDRIRFESIIDFPHFLLHALKIFITKYSIKLSEDKQVGKLLDDKKLLTEFKNVFESGQISDFNGTSEEYKEFLSKSFIMLLLRLRYFYDKYIIKREYVLNKGNNFQNEDGEWSLQKIKYNESSGYKNVEFDSTFDKNKEINKEILMIQAAMRVSYTSPKVMHWITYVLTYLITNDINPEKFSAYCEDYVKKAVTKNFIAKYSRDNPLGVNTPHIVFNYLDYLLWKNDKTKEFEFEFRTSVEHFYPQNPSEESFSKWKDVNKECKDNKDSVNIFGNLCLLQRNINSKFSNLSPTSKIGSYENVFEHCSLKLRLMQEWIDNYKKSTSDSEANRTWASFNGGAYEH